jgi:hypothetical protein
LEGFGFTQIGYFSSEEGNPAHEIRVGACKGVLLQLQLACVYEVKVCKRNNPLAQMTGSYIKPTTRKEEGK